jgi:hypothetical protein
MGEVTRVDTFEVPKEEAVKAPTPETVQEMVKQSRTGVTRTGVDPLKGDTPNERPAWLPEKFKSAEDMAKSYAEMEKKLGQPKAEEKPADGKKAGLESLKIPDKAPETKPDETTTKTPEVKAAEAAGVDIKALEAEFIEKGDLTPESRAKLEKLGFTKDVVDTYISGQVALAEKMNADIESVAGGAEKFQQMHEWSKTNLTAAEAASVNKALDSRDVNQIKLAFAGVHAKWTAAGQNEPTVRMHGSKSADRGDIYTHRDEILKDQAAPLYKESQAERDRVFQKVKRSNIW